MRKAYFAWLLLALLGFLFHEAWRDEAQAWLVAKEAKTFLDLMKFSSLEATPPVYYLILWPFAQLFPEGFLGLQWLVSFTGSALAVYLLLSRKVFKSPFLCLLLCFSFIFGFEFSVVSRLYGWGFFFLFLGLHLDQQKKYLSSALLFALAALTQGPFGLAVFAYFIFHLTQAPRLFFRERWQSLGILTLAFAIFVWQNQLSAEWREWSGSFQFPKRLSLMGGSLASPFLHIPANQGYLGYFIALFSFLMLPQKARLAFGILLAGHIVVFSFIYGHYAGVAMPRHGAALFVMFLYFWQQSEQARAFQNMATFKDFFSHLKARIILKNRRFLMADAYLVLLLLVSVGSGLFYRVQDILFPYSDSKNAAALIQSLAPTQNWKILAWDEQESYALQAYLNTSVIVGSRLQEIRTPQYTKQRSQFRKEDFERGVQWELMAQNCLDTPYCFVVLRSRWGLPPESHSSRYKWIYKGRKTLTDESLNVFQVL